MEPFIGEIRAFPWGWAPSGWLPCDGRILSIQVYSVLYSLIGTTYGGNGVQNFGLPDLRGRSPMHASPTHPVGALGGEESHQLTVAELPPHNHGIVTRGAATATSPAGAGLASAPAPAYGDGPNGRMSAQAVEATGLGQPHPNMQPFQVIFFAIATNGIYPSRG